MKKPLVSALAVIAVTLSLLTAAPSAAATSITKSVCIDPGHGGSDTGTSNGTGPGQILEKDLNLRVAKLVGEQLKVIYGPASVFYTRDPDGATPDVTLSNTERAKFCNSTGATILVSVHHNGSSNHTVDYSQALYQKRVDIPLAKAIVAKVSLGLGTTNKGTTQFASGVLLKSDMPATISEGFFLTNDDEYALLTNGSTPWRDSSRLQAEAQAIYSGIVEYFKTH